MSAPLLIFPINSFTLRRKYTYFFTWNLPWILITFRDKNSAKLNINFYQLNTQEKFGSQCTWQFIICLCKHHIHKFPISCTISTLSHPTYSIFNHKFSKVSLFIVAIDIFLHVFLFTEDGNKEGLRLSYATNSLSILDILLCDKPGWSHHLFLVLALLFSIVT